MNSKHICLLGFSKQIEQELKQYISTYAPNFTLSWVSANAAHLDGVVVNALFLNTSQIEKYLKSVNCPKVSAYSSATGRSTAEMHQITALDLTKLNSFNKEWLSSLLDTDFKRSTDIQISDESKPLKELSNFINDVNLNQSGNFHELIEKISERKQNIIACYEDKITYIDMQKGDAYINFPRDSVPGIEYWRWTISEDTPPSDTMRRLNLDQWLFETIWQSQSTVFNVDSSMLYKLVRWPQPFSQTGRTEALRLAAQIKFQPVTIADLVSKTNYSNNLVEQFLFATAKAGQVEVIKPEKGTKLMADAKPAHKDDPDREVKRSFIGRLRKKLGL